MTDFSRREIVSELDRFIIGRRLLTLLPDSLGRRLPPQRA
jgi:hypothetical protein